MSPDGQWRQGFEALLRDLFGESGLRRWLRLNFSADGIDDELPGPPISLRDLVHATTGVLLHHGLLGNRLFELLAREFPMRRADIQKVLRAWVGNRPRGVACPLPVLTDVAAAATSQELAQAYEARETLLINGADTSALDAAILALRRKLRHGPQLKPGDFLDHGNYRLVDVIGKGGHAFVWRAHDRERRELVAIKILHGQYTHDQSICERFKRGARNMARMNHPSIIRVLRGVFEDEGYLGYVMELAAGGDLRQRALASPIPEPELRELFARLCEALDHAHGRGFVHRDIKPSNVLLDATGAPRLTDFDMMKAADTTGGTRTGAGIGTVLYTHPSLWNNAEGATARTDLYSLGMTLLFCLMRRELEYDLLYRPNEWIDRLDCSDALKRMCRLAIGSGSDQVWSAAEMLRELRPPPPPKPPPPAPPAPPPAKRPAPPSRPMMRTSNPDLLEDPETRDLMLGQFWQFAGVNGVAIIASTGKCIAEDMRTNSVSVTLAGFYMRGAARIARTLGFNVFDGVMARSLRGEQMLMVGMGATAAVMSIAPDYRPESIRDAIMGIGARVRPIASAPVASAPVASGSTPNDLLRILGRITGVRAALIASVTDATQNEDFTKLDADTATDIAKTVRRMIVASATVGAPVDDLVITFGAVRMLIVHLLEEATLVILLDETADAAVRMTIVAPLPRLRQPPASPTRPEPEPEPDPEDEVDRLLLGELGPIIRDVSAVFKDHYQRLGRTAEDADTRIREQLREWLLCCNPSPYTFPLLLDGLSQQIPEMKHRAQFMTDAQSAMKISKSWPHRR